MCRVSRGPYHLPGGEPDNVCGTPSDNESEWRQLGVGSGGGSGGAGPQEPRVQQVECGRGLEVVEGSEVGDQ